jgi:glutamate-ammonia-ligase adenylyltransferase
MIEALGGGGAQRLSTEALRERLRILGFRDVERASRTLAELVGGTSRRARLFKVLTPAILRFLSDSPLPDEGLFSFLRISEGLGERLDAAAAFRDNPPGLAFLARVLGSGRILGDMLLAVPEELATIADPGGPPPPKDRPRLVREGSASLSWREESDRLDGLRRFKRREFLRIVLGDLGGVTDTVLAGAGLADLADACLEAALEECEIPFAVIGMGKLGGRELNYASDIDVVLVHDAATEDAEKVAADLIASIGAVTPEGITFQIDHGLRPEGKAGPLVRSIDSFLEYYSRWAHPWEHQALVKARFAAGDVELGKRFIGETRSFAFPERLPAAALAEIRHLKARMERERIPRGVDPRLHFKLGPGGTSDVEFAIQILQLTHGREYPALGATGTVPALAIARDLELLAPDEADRLTGAYEFLTRVRNRLFLMVGRPVDSLPTKPEELEALGRAMGFRDQPRQELEDAYLRVTRRARRVTEPLIYG